MGGWRRYLELQAQAKTGLSSGLFVWALLAGVFGVLTAGFVPVDRVHLAGRTVRRSDRGHRTIEQAELALAARRNAIWLDPKVLGGAIQVSRAVGWRKLVPLLAVGMLAAGVRMEWFGPERPAIKREEQNGRRKLARAA
jgi:hypothetical protein